MLLRHAAMPAAASPSLLTPDFSPQPYWWTTAPRRALPEATLPATADVVVIGSGYTGLNAALQTARGARSTVVLEAGRAGEGCSTRNGGQVSTSVKPGFAALARRHGAERARAILSEGHEALRWLGAFVEAEAIDCGFTVCGRFHAAHSPRAFEVLRTTVTNQTPGLEVEAHVVSRAEQASEIGSDAYFGGVVYPRHAALDPARYHAGLLDRATQAGATVVEHCPATAIERAGKGFRVATPLGTIAARDVVVATNGYTGPLMPWLRRRVIPIGSYIIATEPLPRETMRALLPNDRVISDTRKVVYYYRLSPDGTRMVFGGRVSSSETDPVRSAPRLHAEMARLFPQLRETRVSHSWMGFVAYTFDTLAHAGVHDGIHYAMGYCGSGVSMASYLGMRAGQKVLGLRDGRTGFDDLPFPTRPFYDGRPWFLAGTVQLYRWRDSLGL